MKNSFIAKLHKWERGILHVVEHLFDTLEDAVDFLSGEKFENAKVLNHHGHVVHYHRGHNHFEHYA